MLWLQRMRTADNDKVSRRVTIGNDRRRLNENTKSFLALQSRYGTDDRPFNGQFILGRNTFTGAGSAVVDVRLAKRVRIGEHATLQILVESFNIQNRVNLNTPNTTWGTQLTPSATFGQFNGAGDPRQSQLGFRLQW